MNPVKRTSSTMATDLKSPAFAICSSIGISVLLISLWLPLSSNSTRVMFKRIIFGKHPQRL